LDTRARDEQAREPARRRRGLSAASGLFNRLLERALATLKPPAAPADKLVFEAFEPRVLLAGDPVVPRIEGSIDVAGETDRYAFTLSEDLRVVFDSLTDNGNIRWSLDGPRGSVVSNRPLSQSDSYDGYYNQGTGSATDLAAGDYMLSIDGVGDTTGAYGFRLINLNQAEELTLGQVVFGELASSKETNAYKFSALAGERFFIDRLSHSNDVYWRLLDPFGRAVNAPVQMGSDIGEITLAVDGSYTLLVEGRAYTTGSAAYSFSVTTLQDSAPTAMALGELVKGQIATAGARASYAFSLDSARRVLFDSLTNNNSLVWSLARADGSVIASRRMQQSDSWEVDNSALMSLAAGDYRLTLDGEGDAVGSYRFRLLDLAQASAFTPGETVEGTLGEIGVTVDLPWASGGAPLTNGQPDRAPLLGSGYPWLRVPDSERLRVSTALTVEAWIRPTGAGTDGTYGGIIVNKEGEYQLARFADGRIGWAIANANPGWTWVDTGYVAPLDAWTHIAFVYDGSTATTYANGQLVHSREATGPIGDVDGRNSLQIGSREAGGQQFIGQIDEVRVWKAARNAADIAAFYNQPLQGNEDALSGYWRLDESGTLGFADAAGGDDGGSLVGAPSTDTRLYRFDATAGQRFFFDGQLLGGDNVSVRLIGPSGNVLWGAQWISEDEDVFELPVDGSYTLAIEGRIGNTNPSSWRFTLNPVSDATEALTPGQTIDAAIEHPGQRRSYSVTLDAATTLAFDSLANRGDISWALAGPNGLIQARQFSNADSGEQAGAVAWRWRRVPTA
jgi:large repetitive protein